MSDITITIVNPATPSVSIDIVQGAIDGSNLGAGAQVFSARVAGILQFRTLKSTGGSIAFTQNANDIDLVATAASVGADVAGAAAAVLATSLQKASNLSDIGNAATARTNLGLGSAATQNSSAFDAAGAAAAVLATSLQKASNLSDLANVATARTNLGLVTPGAVGLQALALATLAAGSILFGSAANTLGALAVGTANQVLTSNGTVPVWGTVADAALSANVVLKNGNNAFVGNNTFAGTSGFNAAVTVASTLAVSGTSSFTDVATIQKASGSNHLTFSRITTGVGAVVLGVAGDRDAANTYDEFQLRNGALSKTLQVRLADSNTITLLSPQFTSLATAFNLSQTGSSTWSTGTGAVSINGAATFASTLTVSGLTSGRIPVAGTAGLLGDFAGLSYVSTNSVLTSGDGTGNSSVSVNGRGTANANKDFKILSAGLERWIWRHAGNETGSNAGTDFFLLARDDTGATIDTPISLVRAAGGLLTIARPTTHTANWDQTGANTLSTGTGAVSINGAATFASTLTVSGLTSGRVMLVGTAGLITDSSLFTYGAFSFIVGDTTTVQNNFLIVRAPVNSGKTVLFRAANVNRWQHGAFDDTESGSDAGCSYQIRSFNDAGASIDTPLAIARAAGGTASIYRPVAVVNNTASTSTVTGALIVGTGGAGGLGVAGAINGGSTLNVLGDATVGNGGAGARQIILNGEGATVKNFAYQVAGVNRFFLRVSGAESGSNSGSAFSILARADDGSALDTPITVGRAAGAGITLARPISIVTSAGTCLTLATTGNNGIIIDNTSRQVYLGTTGGEAAVGTLNAFDLNVITNGATRLLIGSGGVSRFIGNLAVSTVAMDADVSSAFGTPYHWVSADRGTANNAVLTAYGANSAGASLVLSKTRSTSAGGDANTIIQNGDALGAIAFYGSDGATYRAGALIQAEVSAVPGISDMPTDLAFYTTTDGSATVVERLRLSQTGLATFTGDLSIAKTGATDAVLTVQNQGSGNARYIRYNDGTSIKYNWIVGVQFNVDNGFEITPSTAAGGSTFTTTALRIAAATGIATFSALVTANGGVLFGGGTAAAGAIVVTAANGLAHQAVTGSSNDMWFGDPTGATAWTMPTGTKDFRSAGKIISDTGFYSPDTTLHHSTAALANGSGAGAGTISNAPSAGNPTKWIRIDDNGTNRYVPSWT